MFILINLINDLTPPTGEREAINRMDAHLDIATSRQPTYNAQT